MMPAPRAWSARDSTVSPMTGMRGLRPTIMFASPWSMLNLSDEQTSVVVDNVPRKGTAQLRNAERVDGAARLFLRADVR
jgi:hypothetical protein